MEPSPSAVPAPASGRPAADRLVRAALVVVAANVATLVLELIASRVLAPFVGNSLHTWTAIIGVVLAGISVGSFLGGRLADRTGSPRTLAAVLGLSALAIVALVPSVRALGATAALRALPVLPRTFALATWGFFLPTLLLSCVQPLALRLLLPDLAWAGRIAGLLSALGTLGSLVGNFLTGFVLLATFGVTQVAFGTGLALGALALLALVRAPAAHATPTGATPERAAVAADEPFLLSAHPRFTLFLVACTSWCMLAIEVGASRLLAPTLGVSLLSWTGIIGVVLLGMMSGNALGGFIADRWPRQGVLARSLFAAAVACLWIPLLNRLIVSHQWFTSLGLMTRIVVHAAVVFVPPTLALGTISPQVLRLALRDVAGAGSVAGRLWASATLGALVGTFLTGWWLIALVGVYALIGGAAVALVLLGVVVGGGWGRARVLAEGAALLVITGGLAGVGLFKSPCTVETDYYCIGVVHGPYEGRRVKVMMLDLLAHTIMDEKDPGYLGYGHDYIHTEFVRRAVEEKPDARVLVIGGGGYAFPKWIETNAPRAQVDVVEIDPMVTKVALAEFGVRPDTRIRSFNLDGRQFIQELATEKYDLVVQDAVNDLSVPFHLMTKEYDEQVGRTLTPDGVFLVSLIDQVPGGAFLPAAVKTLQAVFPYVELVHDVDVEPPGRDVYVVAASFKPMGLDRLAPLLKAQGVDRVRTVLVPRPQLDALVTAATPVLTDEFVPVDTLLAAVFLQRPGT